MLNPATATGLYVVYVCKTDSWIGAAAIEASVDTGSGSDEGLKVEFWEIKKKQCDSLLIMYIWVKSP